MQFHIPQYVDIEDKLFGPLTLKQAVYVAGGLGGVYLVYRIVPYLFIAAPLIFGIAALTWALAFYPKENLGRPFIEILEAGFNYMTRNKLYIWKKTTKEPTIGKEEEFLGSQATQAPSIPSGKLSGASFKLAVQGSKKVEDTLGELGEKKI